MVVGVFGQKEGMTRIFTEDGDSIPVTVIRVESNKIVQLKTAASEGYSAIQVKFGSQKLQRLTKPLAGHYAKAGVEPGLKLQEFVLPDDSHSFEVGQELNVNMFSEGAIVDVTGTTIGKGFAGTIKRHHFSGQRNSHGNSLSHRVPGAIGQNQSPGKVFKGKKMSGHLGDVRVTTQNLEIVRVDTTNNCLLVKGAVPGAKGGYLIVKPAIKHLNTNKVKEG